MGRRAPPMPTVRAGCASSSRAYATAATTTASLAIVPPAPARASAFRAPKQPGVGRVPPDRRREEVARVTVPAVRRAWRRKWSVSAAMATDSHASTASSAAAHPANRRESSAPGSARVVPPRTRSASTTASVPARPARHPISTAFHAMTTRTAAPGHARRESVSVAALHRRRRRRAPPRAQPRPARRRAREAQ